MGGFFTAPPRPRGRGWRTRAGEIALFGLAFLLGCGGLIGAESEWRRYREFHLAVETGEPVHVTILSRRRAGKSQYVTARHGDRTWEVEISYSEWKRVSQDLLVPGYRVRPDRIVIEPERGRSGSLWRPILYGAGALLFLLGSPIRVFFLLREMRLLRLGFEVVTQGTGKSARIRLGEVSREIRIPADRTNLVQVHSRGGLPGYVVLVDASLRRRFFPSLADLPPESLRSEAGLPPQLPPPIRDLTAKWLRWFRARYGSGWIYYFTPLLVLCAVLLTRLAGPTSAGDWPAIGIIAVAPLLLPLYRIRQYWKFRLLWKYGVETRAMMITDPLQGKSYTYLWAGRDYTFREMTAVEPLEAPPSGVVAPEVVILVDPAHPSRAALVPAFMAAKA